MIIDTLGVLVLVVLKNLAFSTLKKLLLHLTSQLLGE